MIYESEFGGSLTSHPVSFDSVLQVQVGLGISTTQVLSRTDFRGSDPSLDTLIMSGAANSYVLANSSWFIFGSLSDLLTSYVDLFSELVDLHTPERRCITKRFNVVSVTMEESRGAVEFVTRSQIRTTFLDTSGMSNEFWMHITTDGQHFNFFHFAAVQIRNTLGLRSVSFSTQGALRGRFSSVV